MTRLSLREAVLPALLVGILAVAPAVSVQADAWSERLEPVSWFALAGVVAALTLALSRLGRVRGIALGLLVGFVLVSFVYSSFLPIDAAGERLKAFTSRVADWLAAASSGAASTDNLLFAYSMSLLGWLQIGRAHV